MTNCFMYFMASCSLVRRVPIICPEVEVTIFSETLLNTFRVYNGWSSVVSEVTQSRIAWAVNCR